MVLTRTQWKALLLEFRRRFEEKCRLSAYLRRIPTQAIVHRAANISRANITPWFQIARITQRRPSTHRSISTTATAHAAMSAGTAAASASAPPSSATPIAKRIIPRRPAPKTEAGVGKSPIGQPTDRARDKTKKHPQESGSAMAGQVKSSTQFRCRALIGARSACVTNDSLSSRILGGRYYPPKSGGALPNSQPAAARLSIGQLLRERTTPGSVELQIATRRSRARHRLQRSKEPAWRVAGLRQGFVAGTTRRSWFPKRRRGWHSGEQNRYLVRCRLVPTDTSPCITARAPKPPQGPDWVHEIKHGDVYRPAPPRLRPGFIPQDWTNDQA
jgi:hypothetical protein